MLIAHRFADADFSQSSRDVLCFMSVIAGTFVASEFEQIL